MSELRIAVLGVGVMGADYVARITSRISGALIQVGFMRRFDHEYAQLKTVIDRGELGQPAGDALCAPQPRRAAQLRLRDDSEGLAGA